MCCRPLNMAHQVKIILEGAFVIFLSALFARTHLVLACCCPTWRMDDHRQMRKTCIAPLFVSSSRRDQRQSDEAGVLIKPSVAEADTTDHTVQHRPSGREHETINKRLNYWLGITSTSPPEGRRHYCTSMSYSKRHRGMG